MSRNILNCRTCDQPMVATHENGDISFFAHVPAPSIESVPNELRGRNP